LCVVRAREMLMLLHQHKMRVRSLRCRLYDGRFTPDRDFV
jgi:hypothetical protein